MSVTVSSTIDAIELESGTDILELESGADSIYLESSIEGCQVLDDNPVLPIPNVYAMPFFFFQMEPGDQVNPVYYEAWQNLSTQLMPEVYPRDLEGLYSIGMTGGSWEVMQLSTPIFPPDGTREASPTHTTLGSKGTGRTTTSRRSSA